jgi:hypothetical protein
MIRQGHGGSGGDLSESEDADMHRQVQFDVILRYREDLDAFDVTLIYDHPNDREDAPEVIHEPVRFHTDALAEHVADTGAYASALSAMLYDNTAARKAFERAVAATEAHPLHLRMVVDAHAPARYHSIRWETLRDPDDSYQLATHRKIRFSRYYNAAIPRPISPVAKEGRLRALVVAADPSDLRDYSTLGGPHSRLSKSMKN